MAIMCRKGAMHGVVCRESLAFPGVRVTQAKTLKGTGINAVDVSAAISCLRKGIGFCHLS